MKALPPGQCRTEQLKILILLFTAPQTHAVQPAQQGHAGTAWSAVAQGTPAKQCASRTSCSTEMAMKAPWLLSVSLEHKPISQPISQPEESTGSSKVCKLRHEHPRAGDRNNTFTPLPSCDAEGLNRDKRRGHSLYSALPKASLGEQSTAVLLKKVTQSEKLQLQQSNQGRQLLFQTRMPQMSRLHASVSCASQWKALAREA